MSTDDPRERQRVVRLPGSRRARLTPAPGTREEPVPADEEDLEAETGPNDERMRREKPPHY
ncbi:hypothetical protein [Microbacterium sp. KR10-403]|uniref:hypothetical protein n=1 Tax=Microbacterium sp. KR10-403 TaxID=3158581 RepID=UPI0032E4DB9A